jgi:peptide methionine sulfoxide reductase MsrA
MRHLILPMLLAVLQSSCSAKDPAQPEEAGTATWRRDLGTALASSEKSGKPVFALFQEIPGCAGCKQFGREVLSNPLIAAAIETEFTPLLIHNNKAGTDAVVLKRFGEPAWNYQVVRFLDAAGTDIIPRKDKVWETGPLSERMIAALQKAKRPVPAWLSLLASEQSPNLQQVALAMGCFWTGEMQIGQIDGVVTTEAGFIGGREVALVKYDPAVLSLVALASAAAKSRCADALYVPSAAMTSARDAGLNVKPLADYRAAPASDQKKQLQGTAAAKLKLVDAQATKVNAWIRNEPAKALQFLTPAQRAQIH